MTELLLAIAAYLAVGLYLIVRSSSRGIIADLVFALIWPWFIIRHLWKGY